MSRTILVFRQGKISGEMGAALRPVVLTGTVYWDQLTGDASNLPYYLRLAFIKAGFSVLEITAQKQGLFGNTVSLVLKFNVLSQYSGEDVRRSATSVLSNFTYNSVLGNGDTDRRFSNIQLKVSADAGVVGASGKMGGTGNSKSTVTQPKKTISTQTKSTTLPVKATTPTGQAEEIPTIPDYQSGNFVPISSSTTANNLLNNFAIGLGVSTSAAALIAIGLGLIILRR